MTPYLILSVFLGYTILLFIITWFTSRKSNNEGFFVGNRKSPWYIVAYGMIGASLSGVTFMSVPGDVGKIQFSYFVLILGYLAGYIVIATVLLPLYYRLNLTSIYSYLEQRFGFWSHKTGAMFFIFSRVIGASLRMFLVVNVLQMFVFDQWGVPFAATVAIFITLIILYTIRGGIKTIIWTDTLQTTFMLLAVILTIGIIISQLQIDFTTLVDRVVNSEYSKVLNTDWTHKRYFIKQFIGGAFIAISMTGLDQEMMQKNLSCKNIKEAKKNMITFSIVLVFVNFMFLFLGASLYIYSTAKGIAIPALTDDLFPTVALKYLGPFAGIVFMVGLISAAYPSADGALTSLTTSFCIDFLGLKKKKNIPEEKLIKIRYLVHFSFAFILLIAVILFKQINDKAVIDKLFVIAGYTYGPLLGLFAFGQLTKLKVHDKFVPAIAVLSPVLCYVISMFSEKWFNGYQLGYELLLLNGFLTFAGLFFVRRNNTGLSA